eukprot:CAMPEP_0117015240 /NCGR_PEP_ID=MMETSP0472-20121206/12212_1 /TAXON_ID=693140 ORGANISM="Tiarina fusus, Strain LIS" /NCGR_SAMPLE_ID=MMETSP0472 /ASSEMBLY_ACC=CAM_ASM_000603 /LENGTH=488 /DNA_ID=CAMNT_0004718995 /DNA_START=26 /DNA_END=1492 /DNA_ORIENTATION=+
MTSGAKQPAADIVTPHDHDVLSGRGNFVNYHAGNEHFRALVRKHKLDYVKCPKPQKGKFSRIIVDEIKSRNPPGRFLKQDGATKLWYDIGEKKALDKTRQALREGAPDLMKEMTGDTDDDASDGEGDIGGLPRDAFNAMGGPGAMGAGFSADQLPNPYMAGLGNVGLQSPVMARNHMQIMSPQLTSPQLMSPSLMLSSTLSPDMQQLSSRQMQHGRMNGLDGFGDAQVIPPPQVHSHDGLNQQQIDTTRQMMMNAGMGSDFAAQNQGRAMGNNVMIQKQDGSQLVANQAELAELQMLQSKLQAIYSNEQFEPRPMAGSMPLNDTPKQSQSGRVELATGQNPRRMPPPSLLKRDDSLKSDEVFSAALSPPTGSKKKYDGGGSSAHLSAMSLSLGDMNDEGNLSSVFDSSLRISQASEKEIPTMKKEVKDKSSTTWEADRFDMSVATIGGASRFSETGNMSYATFSEPKLGESEGQMSFSKVFEDPDKLG